MIDIEKYRERGTNMREIFGNTMTMTQKSLDFLWLKQTVALNNISNNETPGFKAQYVTFEDKLKNNLLAAGKSDSGNAGRFRTGIESAAFSVHDTDHAARLDGNNVQMEAENVEMARSYLQYQYQMQSLNGDINRLRIAIKG